jgi:hypothetical protein
MEDLFNIIGKLYVDINNMQKVLESLQKQLRDKDSELQGLKKLKENNE